MKFQPVTKSIEMFGHSEVSKMTIAASGKMFRTIISGLYSRKIESICRESVANAKDGHIKRGNPERPSFVHAPTTWEPYYSVRDYGCSMDHYTVMNNYSTIGWSSKEDSNEEIGTFGLGSKSPFAYTSIFSVTTWLDGIQRTYNAYLDEQGEPMVALASESPSEEEQGLMVRFDVRTPDIHAFHKAIKLIALAHSPCFECNIEGVRSAEITSDHGNFYFSSDIMHGPLVQIGCVTYPIDFSVLDSTFATRVLKMSTNLVLRTRIGDLGVVPSREGLEYTEKTIKNIGTYLEDLFSGYQHEVATRCAALTTVWEAAAYYDEIQGHQIKHAIGSQTAVLGKNFKLNETASYAVPHLLRNYVTKAISNSETSLSIKATSVFARRGKAVVYVHDERSENVKFWRRRVALDLWERELGEAMFVTLPDPLAAVKRLRKQLELTNADRKERKSKLDGLFANLSAVRAKLKEQIGVYGCPEVINLLELPAPPPVVRNPKDYAIVTYAMTGSGNFESADGDFKDLDETKFNVVFPLSRKRFGITGLNPAFLRLMGKLKDFDISAIIGVSVSNVKRYLAENPSCILWSDVFNADNFDVSALKARADALASKSVISLEEHETLFHGIENWLTDIGIPLPESVTTFEAAYNAIKAKRDANQKDRRAFEAAGPKADQCALLLELITGERYEPNGVTEEDRSLDALAAKVAEDFPLLADVCENRENYGEEAVLPLIYVLGQMEYLKLFPKTVPLLPTEAAASALTTIAKAA